MTKKQGKCWLDIEFFAFENDQNEKKTHLQGQII